MTSTFAGLSQAIAPMYERALLRSSERYGDYKPPMYTSSWWWKDSLNQRHHMRFPLLEGAMVDSIIKAVAMWESAGGGSPDTLRMNRSDYLDMLMEAAGVQYVSIPGGSSDQKFMGMRLDVKTDIDQGSAELVGDEVMVAMAWKAANLHGLFSQRTILEGLGVEPAAERLTLDERVSLRCSYCHNVWHDDGRGACVACGGPGGE